jgi:K+-transporting ATPase c subunit
MLAKRLGGGVSGLDPDISRANTSLGVAGAAKSRTLSVERFQQLVHEHVNARTLG